MDKITDRMPEDKTKMYLVSNGRVVLICCIFKNSFHGIGGATHWMELPELPTN